DGLSSAMVADDLDPSDPFYAQDVRGVVPGRTGDLILRPARGVIFGDPPDVLQHGSPYDYDSDVPLAFWGADVKVGRSSETARVVDLAPTAGAALGLDFKPLPDSRVLPVLR